MNLEELQKIYKREAKRADQRMRELERATARPEYKHILEWSYARAQDDLSALFGEGVSRFDRTIKSKGKLQKALGAARAFLNSETSTIGKGKAIDGVGETSGIKEMFDDRAQKLNAWMEKNAGYNPNFTTEQFHDFVKNQRYQKMRAKYKGSDVILRRIAAASKRKGEIKKMIAREQHRAKSKITDRDFYNYILREMDSKGLTAAQDLL